MIVPVMAISNLVLTQQIYSEETNGAHAHYHEPVPLKCVARKTISVNVSIPVLVHQAVEYVNYIPYSFYK